LPAVDAVMATFVLDGHHEIRPRHVDLRDHHAVFVAARKLGDGSREPFTDE
jgi:hypothetical protein